MSTVLVTGASGFIAKHIVRELLEAGFTVKASVRSERGRDQVTALFPDADLSFVTLDLTSDAGWDEAMAGVDALMHTASPFPMTTPRDRDELIRPAVDGTLRALGAAQRAGVPKVVLTSSVAAIYKDSAKPAGQASTRDNWTDPDGPATSAYEASKTLAERAAWDFVAAHPEMTLTTICPGAVMGPPMDTHYGTSLNYIEQVLDGKVPFVPAISLPIVDVRDVALMHRRALTEPEAAGQRYPANAETLSFMQAVQIVKQAYPNKKISSRKAPDWLVRTMAKAMPEMKLIAGNLNRNSEVDGHDAERDFSFTYITARDAILASAEAIEASRAG